MQGPQLALSNQSQALAAEAEGDRNLGVLTVEGKSGEDRLLCSLGQPAEGWKTVAAVVDSGAEETVTVTSSRSLSQNQRHKCGL